MNYWFYNTDARSFAGESGAQRLLKHGYAVTGGPAKFGELFKGLTQGDTLLMYENKIGVIAVGTVIEEWDGQTHLDSWYYPPGEPHEYRIRVDWYLDFSSNPIGYDTLRDRIGYIPRGAVKRDLQKHEAIESLIAEWFPHGVTPKSRPAQPGRSECTVQRIIRDTGLARVVKELHQFRCQICGQRIALPQGGYYAEAHHIHPLGAPHDGPDVVENIMCVCPNHHAELDYLSIPIKFSELRLVSSHHVDHVYVDHHNTRFADMAAAKP